MRSNIPFNSSKWFLCNKNIHHYKNNAFSHHWCTMGPESKDNVYTMQFGECLCRSTSSAVRKRGISCPKLKYKAYHGVWRCCCPYRCTECTKIFSVHAYRTSGLYRQQTEASVISQLHHHWKFCHLRSSAKIEINSNLMVHGQGYMVDVILLPNQTLIIFVEWLKICVV